MDNILLDIRDGWVVAVNERTGEARRLKRRPDGTYKLGGNPHQQKEVTRTDFTKPS